MHGRLDDVFSRPAGVRSDFFFRCEWVQLLPPPPAVAEVAELAHSEAALFGPGVEEYIYPSWYADLSTIEGVAGTVGQIVARVSGGPFQGQWAGRCTGVLVARNKVLTTGACMIDLEGAYGAFHQPADLYVRFPQIIDLATGNQAWIPVTGVWRSEGSPDVLAFSSSSMAVLTLSFDLDHFLVAQIAPVFLGDVEAALQGGTLLADDAVVAGFAETCWGCNDYARRLGKLGTPVQTVASWEGEHPFLTSVVPFSDDDPGAAFGSNRLDRGGPLFLREARSNRYVVVGSYLESFVESSDEYEYVRAKRFTYLGRVGDSNPDYDHAEVVRPHLGDFVDGTPCTPNELLAGPNSNIEAEMDLEKRFGGMEFLGDHCDSVPLMLYDTPLVNKLKKNKVSFSVRPWLGKGAVTPEFYEWPVSRFCDCFHSDMQPIDESECLENQCFAGEIHDGAGNWKGIDLSQTNEDGGVTLIPAGSGGFYAHVREGRIGQPETYEWYWTKDVPINVRGNVGGGSFSTRGYLGTSLESLNWTRSERDDLWDHGLRGTVSFRELEYASYVPPDVPPGANAVPCGGSSNCLSWIARPRDFDEDGFFGEVPPWKPGPPPHAFAINEDERYVLMVDREGGVDITDALGPVLQDLEKMKSGGDKVRWLSPVESPASLAELKIQERAAVVTEAGVVFSVLADGGILEAVAAGGSGLSGFAAPMATQSAATSLAGMPSAGTVTIDLPANSKALYAATQGAIFVVKGFSPGSGGMIRRTDLASGLTTTLPFVEPAPAGTILGAAFDPDEGKLFVLDAIEGQARLASYDVAGGTVRILWTVPYSGSYGFVALSRTATGELVLIAGSQSTYTAWLIREKSNGVLAFVGRMERVGGPIDEPVMGAYAPVLAVEAPDGELRYDALDPREFVNGAPCEVL